MKQRLIDANALHYHMGVNQNDKQIFYITGEDIDAAPTIDPESLRPTAHWVKDGEVENPYRGSGTKYHCSACGRRAGYKQRWIYKYCPHCGAKMEDTDES